MLRVVSATTPNIDMTDTFRRTTCPQTADEPDGMALMMISGCT